MSNALAVVADPVSESIPVDQVLNVTVKVEGDAVTATPSYTSVAYHAVAKIVWTLDSSVPSNITFDTPGITLFGEHPNLMWLPGTARIVTAACYNDRANHSYCYRIHLLKNEGGTITPITGDPIIHNEPPSDWSGAGS